MSGGSAGGWDFFVSYAQADRSWAEWIAWTLEEARFRVLVQAWDFAPGTNWVAGIDEGVRRAARTIAVLSEAYTQSVYGATEWRAAWKADPGGQERKLLVARVESCDPVGLLDQVVTFDLFGISEAAARAELLRAANLSVSGGRAKPDSKPPFPPSLRAVPTRVVFPGSGPVSLGWVRPPWEALPPLPPKFVARDDAVAAVRDLLTDPVCGPVVGVLGMGGAGESTLARAVVHDKQVQEAFPDGIVWVEAHPDPDVVALVAEILASFGDTAPVFDVASGAKRLRRQLVGAACLVVVDDVWQVEVLWAHEQPQTRYRQGGH